MNKAERKRIFHELFARFRAELKLVHIHLATGTRVVIRFAGVYEDFRFNEGQVYRHNPTEALAEQDAEVLFALASDIATAVRSGYTKPIESHVSSEEPLLFGADELTASKPRGKPLKKATPKRIASKGTRIANMTAKARETLLYELYSEQRELSCFSVQRTTTETIEVRHESLVHQLTFEHGVAKHQSSGRRISREMFAFLCCFAGDIMAATLEGYKSTNPSKERTSATATQMELPLWQEPST